MVCKAIGILLCFFFFFKGIEISVQWLPIPLLPVSCLYYMTSNIVKQFIPDTDRKTQPQMYEKKKDQDKERN